MSMIILYSLVPSSMTCRRASREGELASTALRHAGLGDDEVLLVGYNGFVEHSGVIIFIWRSEMVLYTEIKIDVYF